MVDDNFKNVSSVNRFELKGKEFLPENLATDDFSYVDQSCTLTVLVTGYFSSGCYRGGRFYPPLRDTSTGKF